MFKESTKSVGYVASASKPYNIWVNIFIIIMFKIISTGYIVFQINLVLTGCINARYFMFLSLLKTESGVLLLIMFWMKLHWISMPLNRIVFSFEATFKMSKNIFHYVTTFVHEEASRQLPKKIHGLSQCRCYWSGSHCWKGLEKISLS